MLRKKFGDYIRICANNGSLLPYLGQQDSPEKSRAYERFRLLNVVAEIFYPWNEYEDDNCEY